MRTRAIWTRLSAALLISAASHSAAAQIPYDRYINHYNFITRDWVDTPYNVGLLDMLEMEVEIAAAHAALAVEDPGNIGAIKLHVGHIMHATDPTVEIRGPGEEYGIIKAAKGVMIHAHAATRTRDSHDRIKTAGQAVRFSAANIVEWGMRVMALGQEVLASDDAAYAMTRALAIKQLIEKIENGVDANGDGRIAPAKGEGGLAQINEWITRMR